MESRGRLEHRPLISHTKKKTMSRPIRRYELVELPIPTGFTGNQLNFPDIPLLRSDTESDVVILAMRVYTGDVLPLTPAQNTTITTEEAQRLYLSLYNSGEFSINQIPLPDMITQYINDSATASMWVPEEKTFDSIQVDWTKSFIQFSAPVTGLPKSMLFGVTYLRLLPGTMNAQRAARAAANQAGVVM